MYSKRSLSALRFLCESCIKTHFFHWDVWLILFASHMFKLCATVNVILAAAVVLCAYFSSSMLCIYWTFSVCGDRVRQKRSNSTFSLFVLRQTRPTSSHFSVKRLTDAFFSVFELYRVDMSLSWRKIRYTRLLWICSVFVLRQLRLCGCLLLLFTVWPWRSGTLQPVSASWLSEWCIRLVNVLWKRCKRSFYWTNAAPVQPSRYFSCGIRRGRGEKGVWQYLHHVFRNVPIYFIILA